MIAAFLQVHYHIKQGHLISTSSSVQGLKVSGKDKLVIFPKKHKGYNDCKEDKAWVKRMQAYYLKISILFSLISPLLCS